MLTRRFFGCWLCLLLLIGCASETGLRSAEPRSVGMDTAKLAAITPAMQRHVDIGTVSGVVTLLAKDGKVVYRGSVGLADRGAGRAMEPDTLFRIASMTKPITATALMILVDEGKVRIDDPVSRYIPAFASVKLKSGSSTSRPVTLKDCLTHTAGLGGQQIFDGSLAANVDELIARGLDFQPGEKWQYSPGLNVIGRVIEIASGRGYEEFVTDRIFKPLGMADTTFSPSAEQWERITVVYQKNKEGALEPVKEGWSEKLGRGLAAQPSGGLFSTADDLARFYQMVLNGGTLGGHRVLSRESVEAMTRIQTDGITAGFTPGHGWGLGWCIVREPRGVTAMLSTGTYGHGSAFGTQGWVDPQRKMIFILLIQQQGLPNADNSDLRRDFQSAAAGALAD